MIILASGSATRAGLLQAAGVAFEVIRPEVDEDAEKARLRADGLSVADQALGLALAKARSVAAARTEDWVIGADQMLDLDGAAFDKPVDLAVARDQLLQLRGRRHVLQTAIALLGPGGEWTHLAAPALHMRMFSDAFLDDYLHRAGQGALGSVGGYQLEGLGVQLFAQIDGDYSAILGLPLLPLLAELRRRGALAE